MGRALILFRIESERVKLPAPFGRRIAEPLDADAAGQATFYGRFDKIGCEEGERDGHIDRVKLGRRRVKPSVEAQIAAGVLEGNAGQFLNQCIGVVVSATAEPVEPRAGAKGNASQQSTLRTQCRKCVSQALERIRQVRRHSPKVGAVCGVR